MKLEFLKKYFPYLLGLFVFLVYLTTIAPTVVKIDSGELTAVEATLGIAHPTGYPLFTLAGFLFSLLPLTLKTAFQLNILAALYCAAGVGIFSFTALTVLKNIDKFSPSISKISTEKKQKAKNSAGKNVKALPDTQIYLSIIFGSLILAFGRTFWAQSTSVEVYSLHILLINLIILFLVKAYLQKNNKQITTVKAWLFFAFALALGFGNHMTTLLILPGVAYFYLLKYGLNKSSIKRVLFMLLLFFAVLIALYSYLPIRASQNPLINWGDPVDLDSFMRHVMGHQYQVWLFSSAAAAKKQLIYFVNSLWPEFRLSLIIIAIGIFTSFVLARRFFLFLAITFFSTVLYSINYDINDIDSYFLLAYISLAFFAVFGVLKLLELLQFKKFRYYAASSVIGAIVVLQFFTIYPQVNQSNTYIYEDYTRAVINSTPTNSIIFTYQWDYLVSPSYYLQFVENFRRNTAIIDKELLRRSWYYNQLNTDHPYLLAGIQSEVSSFLDALKPFEEDKPYNSAELEKYYRMIMTNLISTNIEKHPYYIAPELFEKEMQRGEFRLPQGYSIVPDLLLFKVVNSDKYVPAPDPNFKIRFPDYENHYTKFIKNLVGSMLARRALYEMQFDKVERAKLYIKKIKTDYPDYNLPQGLAEVIGR